MFWMDMLVLCCGVGSCANFSCTIRMKESTGTVVKRALTWCDVINSPGSSLMLWICWTKCGGFWGKPVLLPPHKLWTPYWTLWIWWGAKFMNFGEAIKLRGDSTCGIQFPVLLVTESSRLFYVLKYLYKLVFESIGRAFVEDVPSTPPNYTSPPVPPPLTSLYSSAI